MQVAWEIWHDNLENTVNKLNNLEYGRNFAK